MNITAETHLNGVIGYPLSHTKSPSLHNTVYERLAIDAVFLAFSHTDIVSLMQAIQTLSMRLIAVTMPFKEKVMDYLDHCSPEVIALKAANTIVRRQDGLHGYNTDVDGIAYAMRDVSFENKNVLVLGAGGAARAAAYFLSKKQAQLFYLNRSPEKASVLADCFGGAVIDEKKLSGLSIDVIINTTPLGMYPNTTSTPFNPQYLQSHQVVFDMVYNPMETTLLNNAKAVGAKTLSGLDMFIGQGLRQIELWTGKKIDISEIANQLIQELR